MISIESVSVGQFLSDAGPLFAREPVKYNLIQGLAELVNSDASPYETAHFWTVRKGDEVVGAVMQTPPHRILATELAEATAGTIAGALLAEPIEIPGFVGPPSTVDYLSAEIAKQTGRERKLLMDQGIYECTRVIPPASPSGAPRWAEVRDLPVVTDFAEGFNHDLGSLEPLTREQVESRCRARIEEQSLLVWEDGGQVVTMAAYMGRTEQGCRVGYVYTPNAYRRRGYGSAVVAELTQRLLDSGLEWCMLYTDLMNPTSNGIYQAVGYERVGDSRMWDLG